MNVFVLFSVEYKSTMYRRVDGVSGNLRFFQFFVHILRNVT
jgi:hypothetical protein